MSDQDPFQTLLESLVEARAALVVKSLVIAHHNGTLTAQEALSGIAEIAGLRSLPAELSKRIRNTK